MYMLLKILVILGLLFVSGFQPMMIIFSMILLTLFYAIYVYMIVDSFWYSYMMLLVMLSGVLILFTYMVSLLPNERFEIMSMAYIGMICLMLDVIYMFILIEENYDGIKMWWGVLWFLNVFLFMFLLVIMVMVVWITLLEKSPMRIM